jgi:hypothetical protein
LFAKVDTPNPADGMDIRLLCLLLCYVGSVLRDEPIAHSEKSSLVWVCVCVCESNCV